MKNVEKIGLVTIISIILFSTICNVKAETSTTENMETFLDHEIPGIKIVVNATRETEPNKNITIIINMKPLEAKVCIEYFNFSVFGFVNGTLKTIMPLHPNVTDDNWSPSLPYEHNFTCQISEQVWGITLGEITLNYNVTYTYPEEVITRWYNFKLVFDMTYVENIYLEQLKQIFHDQLGKDLTPENLNETLLEYKQLKESQNELGSTRMVVGILVITTVFFAATTLYLILRKPKEYW